MKTKLINDNRRLEKAGSGTKKQQELINTLDSNKIH